MATRVSDGGSADRQRRAQRGLSRLLVRDVRRLRRLIVPSRLQATVPDWIDAVRALVEQYGDVSASLAADYYDAERVAAAVTGRFTVPLLDPPPPEQVDNSLRWATKDVWPRDPEQATDAQQRPLEERLAAAEVKAEAVAQKLVTDQGRGTVRTAAARDRQAVGWARSAALGACAFCKLLAARGSVYGRESVKFRAHDGCHCMAVPVFRGQRFELSEHAAEWRRIYEQHAQGRPGDQLRLFRQALADAGQLPTL